MNKYFLNNNNYNKNNNNNNYNRVMMIIKLILYNRFFLSKIFPESHQQHSNGNQFIPYFH
jgi:hypothetical protein